MLRYIIGISLITIVIMIIRRLSNGMILKRHQYAMWLLIPVYMIVSPFIKISIPVAEELSFLIPAKTETVITAGAPDTDDAMAEAADIHDAGELESQQLTHIENKDRVTVFENITAIQKTERNIVDRKALLNGLYCSVTAISIILLAVYNTGFIVFCRRNRKYIGTDSKSGLAIYGIKHKSVPFLLFNKIYIDIKNTGISKYAVCHEACHYKHGDYIWVIVRYLILALNWYNPLIWCAFILSGRDCELACDEEVIAVCGKESFAEYAETLLVMAQQRSGKSIAFSVTTGMKSSYKNMKSRIVSIAHPSKLNLKVLALCLVSLIVISCFSVLEPKAAEIDVLSDKVVTETAIEAPVKREAPFDYGISTPEISDISATKKELTFYRDGNAVKGIFVLPEGDGPFKTVVLRGIFGTRLSDYEITLRALAENGYAAILLKNNYENEIIAREINGASPIGDLYFEQVLDLYAVLDELRYIPDIDPDYVYLWGEDIGGLIAAYTGIMRQSEIRGMILVGPYLSAGEYTIFSEDPRLVAQIYEMFKECNVPVVIVENRNSRLAPSYKAINCLPEGDLILIDVEDWLTSSNYECAFAEATVDSLNSWN